MSKIETVAEWFDRVLPEKFDPAQTGGFSGTFLFKISGDGGGDWNVTIDGGDLSVKEGPVESPLFTVNMKAENFIKMMNGDINGQQAFLGGKLKFKGNMAKAMKLQSLLF